MGLEGESKYYRKGRNPKVRTLEDIVVDPGDVRTVNNKDVIVLQALVDIDNSRGTVNVVNKKKGNRCLEGIIVRHEGFRYVNLSLPVVLVEGERFIIKAQTKTGSREVSLVFKPGDVIPAMPAPFEREPVLV